MEQNRYIEINGLKLHYLEWGKHGLQPMLLLHGFTGHAHVWDDFASRFERDYHVIALDQRGHGDSEWSTEGFYSLDDYLADIIIFLSRLNKKNIVLLGHSMGGRHALFYAAVLPQNVSKLILVDARVGKSSNAAKQLRYLLSRLPLEARSFEEAARAIWDLYPQLTWPTCQHLASHGYKQNRFGIVAPKYDIRMSRLVAQFMYLTEDLNGFLEGVQCPTLIIRGADSDFLSKKEAEKICRVIPDAFLREIPRSTHMPMYENPTSFYSALNDFLNR